MGKVVGCLSSQKINWSGLALELSWAEVVMFVKPNRAIGEDDGVAPDIGAIDRGGAPWVARLF